MDFPKWMQEAVEAQGFEMVEMVGSVSSEYGIRQPIIRAESGGSTYYGVFMDGIAKDGSEIDWCNSEQEARASAMPW